MRNLTKTDKPQVLTDNEASWLGAITAKQALGLEPTSNELSKYRHPAVKTALMAETHGKCAYCESKVQHIAYGDVEHIHPKDSAPEKRFEWDNLTIACDVCNTNKGATIGVIDPYIDNPEDGFFFMGPSILARMSSQKARFSEIILKLNRPHLVERRMKQIERITALAREAHQVNDPNIRSVLIEDIKINETSDDVEYAAMARAYVKSLVAEGEL